MYSRLASSKKPFSCPLPSPAPSSAASWSSGTATPHIHTIPLPRNDPILDDVLSADKNGPVIKYDLCRNPRYIRLSSANKSLSIETLRRAACQPKIAHLSIRHKSLPWELKIRAKGAYLTVQEVLDGLYNLLQLPIKDQEWSRICQHSPTRVAQIERAAEYRKETSDNRKYEESVRLKRVDVLEDEFIFGGLQWDADGVLTLQTQRAYY